MDTKLLVCFLAIILGASAEKVADPDPKSCELCKEYQKGIIQWTSQNVDKLIAVAKELCEVGGSGGLCSYMVENFTKAIGAHKLNFLLKTNYICNKILDNCPSDFVGFNFTDFKDQINQKFPKTTPQEQTSNFPRAKKSNFKVLVMNDIHIQNDYLYKANWKCKDPAGCCAKMHGMPEDKKYQAGYWGTPKAYCDMPEYFYNKTLQFIKSQPEKFDFIVLLGDNVGHQYFRQEDTAVSDATAVVLQEIKRVFPDIPVVPVLGNHECHPVEYLNLTQYDNWVFKNIINQFEAFIPVGKINQFKEKGYFSLEFPDQNLKFISINSQILDGFNAYLMDVTSYPWDFLKLLARELYQSEKSGQKVIMLNHIEITDYFAIRELNQALMFLLERFQDTIISYLSGHTHNDQLRFMRDQKGKIFGANYISPSITTYSCYNPTYRIYEYADDKLLDYQQYYFDIDASNEKANQGDFTFEFKLAYSFLDRYGLKDTGKEELARLFERLRSKTDPVVEKYVSGYYCQLDMKFWEDKRDEVLCELSDDLDEIYRCMWRETRRGMINNMPAYIFRKLLVSEARIDKEEPIIGVAPDSNKVATDNF